MPSAVKSGSTVHHLWTIMHVILHKTATYRCGITNVTSHGIQGCRTLSWLVYIPAMKGDKWHFVSAIFRGFWYDMIYLPYPYNKIITGILHMFSLNRTSVFQ
jgi:hypothetical protein